MQTSLGITTQAKHDRMEMNMIHLNVLRLGEHLRKVSDTTQDCKPSLVTTFNTMIEGSSRNGIAL